MVNRRYCAWRVRREKGLEYYAVRFRVRVRVRVARTAMRNWRMGGWVGRPARP